MWLWCQGRDIDIKHLAMQFCLDAPVDGIVMSGPANRQQLAEAYEAASQEVPADVWEEFGAEFGVEI